MSKEVRPNLVRVNMYMSEALRDFYKQYAEEMGSSMSAVMIMALKQYMDTQKGIQIGYDLRGLLQSWKDSIEPPEYPETEE